MREHRFGIMVYLVLSLMLLTLSWGCNNDSSTGIQSSTAIAYIYYATDSYSVTSANSFKALLEANSFSTTLIEFNEISSTNFSLYDAILVGVADPYSSSGWDGWFNYPSLVDMLKNSGKPTLAIGDWGGYDFFRCLDLAPGGVHYQSKGIWVADSSLELFHTPNSITIPDSGEIALYTTVAYNWHPSFDAHFLPSDALPIGGILAGPYETHLAKYVIIQQQKYIVWGFSLPPSYMTRTGKALFINIVVYLINL